MPQNCRSRRKEALILGQVVLSISKHSRGYLRESVPSFRVFRVFRGLNLLLRSRRRRNGRCRNADPPRSARRDYRHGRQDRYISAVTNYDHRGAAKRIQPGRSKPKRSGGESHRPIQQMVRRCARGAGQWTRAKVLCRPFQASADGCGARGGGGQFDDLGNC